MKKGRALDFAPPSSYFIPMLKLNLSRPPVTPSPYPNIVAEPEAYRARLAELDRKPPLERIPAIEQDLKKVASDPTGAATFHRKKLLRMHDAARLEAGLVTPAQLQKENNPFTKRDFRDAYIVWQPRRHRA